jgi:hypothetical protein
LSRRDEQFNFAYDTKSHRFYEQIRASSIKDKSVKKSNKLMSFIQAFWKVFHKKELLKIVNNFKLLGRKKLQKVTKLEIKKNNLFTNKKVLKPSFELRKTEKYLNVVKEIMKEETNLTIKDEILKIAENCITRRRIRTFARFNFFAATGKKSHELKFEDLEDIFKMF